MIRERDDGYRGNGTGATDYTRIDLDTTGGDFGPGRRGDVVPPPLRRPPSPSYRMPERPGWSALRTPEPPPPARPDRQRPRGPRLRVDWPECKAHQLCHELLPEVVQLDEWGYPLIDDQPLPDHLIRDARRAVVACPTLALRLIDPA